MIHALVAAALALVVAAAGCARPQRAPLQLDGNRLTVYNGSGDEWQQIEIRLNHHFRVQPKDMKPGDIFQAPLDVFVAGYGQRFNFNTMQITDLRLTAKRPDGEPVELQYQFQKGGLEGALEGFKGKQ